MLVTTRDRYALDKHSVLVQKRHIPKTKEGIARALVAARDEWNAFASKNKEARLRYEQKFDHADRISDPYQKHLYLENLCFHDEKSYFKEAAPLYSYLVQLEEVAGATGADKLIIDQPLNEVSHWWKVLDGVNSEIHQDYEPAKGKMYFTAPAYPPMKSGMHETDSTQLGSFKVSDSRAATNES